MIFATRSGKELHPAVVMYHMCMAFQKMPSEIRKEDADIMSQFSIIMGVEGEKIKKQIKEYERKMRNSND